MDNKVNATNSLYFNILFDSVEEAIKYRKKRLELGRTAREAKASLGCQPEYFNDYIRIDQPIAAFLSKALTGCFQAEIGENWKERNPFKKAE